MNEEFNYWVQKIDDAVDSLITGHRMLNDIELGYQIKNALNNIENQFYRIENEMLKMKLAEYERMKAEEDDRK